MAITRARYPGAQPFSDDPFSQRIFFGRQRESKALTDQIIANRFVVVYAKSGLGKSSLLNAGVAPRLREEGHLPLIVRVNDVGRGPIHSVLDGIRREAERQQVEYVEGMTDSLWSFFKSVELWRADLLLTPILILDQFEELFTLHSGQARDVFLSQLSHLVRGVRPRETQIEGGLTERPPMIRVVLSLREDYLGLLDDAADYLPQILDHRFRLSALTPDAAAEAMIGPAEIEDACLATRPFRYDGGAVGVVMTYLSHRRAKSVAQTSQYIEPFQLQLVCQRVEQIVTERQRVEEGELIITTKDIGGEAAIRETLRNFYTSSVGALPTKRARRAVRRLCEQFLISPEGRRLSLEEMEIRKQLNLSQETLRLLVTRRLLRSENRSDSSYYELSHDALIEPVLATRRRKALLFGWLGLGISSIGLYVISIGVIFNVVFAIRQPALTPEWVNNLVGIPFLASLGIVLLSLSRRNLRTLRRYRPRTADELADTLVAGQSRMSIAYGIIGILTGGYILCLALFLGASLTVNILNAYMGNLAHTDPFSAHFRQSISEMGLGLDTIAYIISVPVVLLFGVRLLRWGIRRLLQTPLIVRPQPTEVSSRTLAFRDLALIAGPIVLLAAVFLAGVEFVKIGCAYHLPLPDWAPLNWFNFLDYDCQKYYLTGYSRDALLYTLTFVLALIAEATLLFVRTFSVTRELLQQARSQYRF